MFGKGLADFAHKAAAQAATAAAAASRASTDALRQGKIAAHQAVSGNPALALVGQELRVSGRHLLVESLLAEGGFAVVYLVSAVVAPGEPPSGEKLVLKKMFAGGPETVAQLTGEVKLMQSLSHPNIVRVLGAETRAVGREGVEILVLMELCPGGHLLARLNQQAEAGRPLPPAKVADVFLSIVRPVAYMHGLVSGRGGGRSGGRGDDRRRHASHRPPSPRSHSRLIPHPPTTNPPTRPPRRRPPRRTGTSSLRTCSSPRTAPCGCATLAPRPRTRAWWRTSATARSRRTPSRASPRRTSGRPRWWTCTPTRPWTRAWTSGCVGRGDGRGMGVRGRAAALLPGPPVADRPPR